MRGNQVQKKGGTLKAVICFIVGLILGIAIVVGTVAGGALYVLNSDLDGVLSTFGVDNSVDPETERNKIINTDPEKGGAKTLMDLISKVTSLASNPAALTLGQIDELIPATRGLVDSVAEAIQDYVAVDFEELSAVVFSEFGTYLQNKVMEIQPASFLDSIQVEGTLGTLLEKLLYGVEANCVIDNSGTVYPLMLDTFRLNSSADGYIREEDSAALLTSQNEYVIRQSGGELYNLYFYEYNGGYYIAEINRDDSSKFIFAPDDGHRYVIYSEETAQNSGNYYVGADGEKVTIDPVTIGSLADGSGLAALEQMRILELLSSEGAPDELLESILGDIMLGDLMNGTVDFQEKVNGLELGAFLSFDPFEDSMLLYFAYGLTGLSATADSQGRYTATYKLGEEDIPVYVTIENGKIDKITNAETGEELSGTTVGTINSTIDNIEISIFVEVTTDNGILPYLAYGITGMKEEDGVWTATLDGEECTLNVDPDGKILSVTNNVTGKSVPAAGINDLSGRVNGVMDSLTIGDIIDVGDNKILKQLETYKISELSSAMNTIEISGLIDVPSDNKIIAYLAYGITDINVEEGATEGTAVLHKILEGGGEETCPVTLTVEDGKITSVKDSKGVEVPGTTIDGINDRLDKLNGSVPLKDLIAIPEGNTLLEKLGEYTLDNIGGAVDSIEIADVIDIGVDDSAIMLYLAFGVCEITYDDAQEVYTAEQEDGTSVYFKTREKDGNKYFEGMYSEPEFTNKLIGTRINGVSERINDLTSKVKIKYLIGTSEDSSPLMEKIGEYTINTVDGVLNDLTLPDVMSVDASSKIMVYLAYGITEVDVEQKTAKLAADDSPVYLELSEDGKNIVGVYTSEDHAGDTAVGGTLVNNVGQKIDGLTNDLKIKDILDIPADDKLLSKIGEYDIAHVSDVVEVLEITDVMSVDASSKIMAYLAYGITEVKVEGASGTAKLGKETVNLTVAEGKITAVTKQDGNPVPGTKVGEMSERIDGLTNDLKIKDLIDIPADDKLLSKIGEYEINNVSNVVDVLEITDVMSVDANSVIMAYLAYGINQVDVEQKTAKLDGEEVKLTIENGNITAVTKQDGNPVPGTKVGEMSERITGLMNTLTIGELITVDAGNTILNAIKDSTINGIGNTISSLTLNELYADEVYKVSSYEDKDGNGQYNPENGETMTYINAKLRKAVSGESTRDDEIKFDAKYLYYTQDGKGSYHLVQIEGKELGKLDSLDGGDYYTYGEVQGMWTLLLTDESGAESALVLNGIGGVITGVADRLNNSTLRELDAAGILDFESAALDYQVDFQGTKLGDLKLTEALSKLVDLVSGISGSH